MTAAKATSGAVSSATSASGSGAAPGHVHRPPASRPRIGPLAIRTGATAALPASPRAGPAPVAAPRVTPQTADNQSALLALLRIEEQARAATSLRDLGYLAVNETRKLIRARQVLLLAASGRALRVEAISSVAAVDRNVPLVTWIEALATAALDTAPADGVALDTAPGPEDDRTASTYPFREMFLLPLRHRDGTPLGALVVVRETPWTEPDLAIARRLAGTFAHARAALQAPRRLPLLAHLDRSHAAIGALAAIALALVPVPLTALAPAEVVARGAHVVAAPLDGVVEEVTVEPNQPVKAGDLVVRMSDTVARNRLAVAEREVTVAEARLKQATQLAFNDPRGMHELGIARGELEIKVAERTYAAELAAKTRVLALRDGIAVFADKRELTGKPVAVGERLIEIADPGRIELRIELPVADAIALADGARVSAFLDSDPIRPYAATIERSDYKARPGEGDVAVFRIVASIEAGDRELPRLGVRGTAQIYGSDVPLAFYLFRRPIAHFRQWTGL